MHRALVLIVAFAFVTLASAQTVDLRPTTLLVSIEAYMGESCRAEFLPGSGTVLYRYNPETFTDAPNTKIENIDIPKERWTAFWKRLDEAKVWSWKKDYARSPNIPD